MNWREWLNSWGMTSLKIKPPFLEMEFSPGDHDKAAAWDLYVELLTRITTQALPDDDGVEQAALSSVFKLFELTRTTLKSHGRKCAEFSKIAVVVLNQVIRPFTARWHKLSTEGAFADPAHCKTFRSELVALQADLRKYTKMLADMAGVEDLTDLEEA